MLRLFIGFILGENRQPSNLFESYEDILQRKRAQERRYRCELLLTLHCDSLHNSVLGLITKTKIFFYWSWVLKQFLPFSLVLQRFWWLWFWTRKVSSEILSFLQYMLLQYLSQLTVGLYQHGPIEIWRAGVAWRADVRELLNM